MSDRLDKKVANGEIRLSELGRKILEARRAIERSGIALLTDEELDRERAERKGRAS